MHTHMHTHMHMHMHAQIHTHMHMHMHMHMHAYTDTCTHTNLMYESDVQTYIYLYCRNGVEPAAIDRPFDPKRKLLKKMKLKTLKLESWHEQRVYCEHNNTDTNISSSSSSSK